MSSPVYFEYKSKKYIIKITYWQAIHVYPEKFDIDLTELFVDNNKALQTMQTLVLQDQKTVKLMWHFLDINAQCPDTEEQFLTDLTPEELDKFREAFWCAVTNFSGPLKKKMMEDLWIQFKKEIKDINLESLISELSVSEPSPEE